MTLRDAQMMAVDGLKEALKNERPKVYVEPFEGILSITVASHRFKNTPAFLVSPVAEDGNGVSLAIYFLAASEDRGQISVLDKAVEAIRNLSGDGRTPLEVSAKSAYDDNALRQGLRIWVLMATWPHLADGTGPVLTPFSGPVAEAMERIRQLFPDGTEIAISESERRRWLTGHKLPFVTISAEKAEFDRTEARRIFGVYGGKRWEAAAKGAARWTVEVRGYAATADDAEMLIWPVVPYIPSTEADSHGFNTSLRVAGLERTEEQGASVFSVICSLEVPAYREPMDIDVIRNAIVHGKEE